MREIDVTKSQILFQKQFFFCIEYYVQGLFPIVEKACWEVRSRDLGLGIPKL